MIPEDWTEHRREDGERVGWIRPAGDLTPGIVPTSHPTLDNFVQAWTTSQLPGAILTSVLVTVVSCVVVVVLATMAAYPLARSTARLSNATFYVFMIGLLLPFQLALLPLYTQMRDLGLLGTVWSLFIVYGGVQMPFSVFLITTFLRASVPLEYEEAARIDGCGNARAFWHVVVPLLRPAIGTAIIQLTLVESSILREWVVNVGRRDARARIAHILCEFAVRLESRGLTTDHGFELPMTQEQLADATGLTSVHVNRVLKSLEAEGLISRKRRQIHFSDWRALQDAGDFSRRYLHISDEDTLAQTY